LPLALGIPELNLSALADDNDFSSASGQIGLDPPVDVTASVTIEKHLDTEFWHGSGSSRSTASHLWHGIHTTSGTLMPNDRVETATDMAAR
jgi:hypothetical protein